MSVSEVIINEHALLEVSLCIKNYAVSLKTAIESAISKIKSNQADWADEDYNDLINVVNALLQNVDGMGKAINQLVVRIDNKLRAIQSLYSIKI